MSIVGSEQWMYSAGGEFYNFPIGQSLRFEDGDSAYLSRTPASAGNRKTWTFSAWLKRGNLGSTQMILVGGSSDTDRTIIRFGSSDNIEIDDYTGSYNFRYITNAVFRDVSAFYNITVVADISNATTTERVRLYVNGERITSFSTESTPLSGINTRINNNVPQQIGKHASGSNQYYDGYMAEINFVDGTALDPTSFGQTKSGIWIPKDTAGLTFGTNGFRLGYANSAAIGDDTSGNTNDFTVNNLVASDVVLDSPTNNFGVMSSIDKGDGTATYSEGNLKVSVGDNEEAFGSFGMSSGKWYWEIRYVSSASSNNKIGLGIADTAVPNNNEVTNNGHQGTTYAPNDILAVAVDVDNETFSFYKNGSIIETDTDWSAKGWASIKPIVTSSNSSGEEVCILNFGQDDTFAGAISATGNTDENGQGVFKYTPPSGFLSLCSANLPSGAIDTLADETPEDYFNTVLYSGNNNNSQTISGVGFEPSMLWIKCRDSAEHHHISDAVRGANKFLFSNETNAERTGSHDGGENTVAYTSDGFSFTSTGVADEINFGSRSYVAWNWKANGAGVSNTDGSITSTVSVGATSQQNWFSIVSWTGTGANATVGHGLNGATPELILLKNRNDATNWTAGCTHYPSGWQNYQRLNDTSAVLTASSVWNNTAPATSVFSVGTSNGANGSGDGIIAYCFANAEGLCKVGAYGPGTGNSNGPFVFTGFRPAFILVKGIGGTINWAIRDNKRLGRNPTEHYLIPDLSNVEGSASSTGVDFLSNGFRFRGGSGIGNLSGANYIYLAIAEQPFKYANAR